MKRKETREAVKDLETLAERHEMAEKRHKKAVANLAEAQRAKDMAQANLEQTQMALDDALADFRAVSR